VRCLHHFSAAADAEVIWVIGANPTVNHPVAATFIKNAAKRGAKLIVMDPRYQTLSRHANQTPSVQARQRRCDAECDDQHHHHRGAEPTSNISRVIPRGYDDLKAKITEFTPERMAPICGILPAETIREGGAHVRPRKILHHLLGHGASASMCNGTDNRAAV